MVKSSVHLAKWKKVVDNSVNETADIQKLTNTKLSKTNLGPFKGIHSLANKLNSSLKDYKDYVGKDALRMTKAGENKVDDDRQGAANLKKGGH